MGFGGNPLGSVCVFEATGCGFASGCCVILSILSVSALVTRYCASICSCSFAMACARRSTAAAIVSAEDEALLAGEDSQSSCMCAVGLFPIYVQCRDVSVFVCELCLAVPRSWLLWGPPFLHEYLSTHTGQT